MKFMHWWEHLSWSQAAVWLILFLVACYIVADLIYLFSYWLFRKLKGRKL